MHEWLNKTRLAMALALWALVQASAVRAQPASTFRLEWNAPESCPVPGEVQAEIDRLLGGAAGERVREDLSVRAAVEHVASGWLVTLDTTSGPATGHRTIEAATCQGLSDATALIVALMIDPDAVASHTEKDKEAPAKAPLPAPPPPANRATFGLVGIGAAGSLGVLPKPDVGISADIGLAWTGWRVELRAVYSPRKVASDALANPPGTYARFQFFAGTVTGCRTISRSIIEVGPCAGIEVGAVRGEGMGFDKSDTKTTAWVAAGAGGIIVFKANAWLQFPVHADAMVPLHRPNYVFNYDGDSAQNPIFHTWLVGARVSAGAELRF